MKNNDKDFVFKDFKIKATHVRVIDGEVNLGLLPLRDAIQKAYDKNLSLIQVSVVDGVPLCKILDYGKYKYDLSKKNKEISKKRRESTIEIKEIKLKPSTDTNDLKTKARQASEFLAEGDRVKVSLYFKGREMTHKEVGIDTLSKFMDFVEGGKLASEPQMNCNCLTVMLEKK